MLDKHRAFATIPASDIARAKRWYQEKLGLKPSQETPAGAMYQLARGHRLPALSDRISGEGAEYPDGVRIQGC
jgi:catechol 2,3-dioxygenase-like lactoylglutathione lyase family enzyme